MSTRKYWTTFGGFFFAGGLIFLLAGLYASYRAYGDAERLAHEGQVAEGIVLERNIETYQANGRPRKDYRLVYRFTTADGQTFTDEAGVDRATWDRLVERSPVRIIYVPGTPSINALVGHEPEWALALIPPAIGLVLATLGGFVLIRVRRQGGGGLASDTAAEGARMGRSPGIASAGTQPVERPTLPPGTRRLLLLFSAFCFLVPLVLLGLLCQSAYEEWRYAHDEIAASCTVTGKSIEQADANRNSSTRYLAHCQFATSAGEMVEGHYALPVAAWELLTPGSTLAITYLPTDPGRSRLAGDDWETAGIALMILIPFAAVFLLFGGLCLQRAQRGPWRELWSRTRALTVARARRSAHRATLRPPAVAAPTPRRFPRLDQRWIWIPAVVVGSALLAVPLADSAAMRAVNGFVDAHRLWLLVPAIPLGMLGFILFLGSGLTLLIDEGKPLSREELDAFYRAQGTGGRRGPGLSWRRVFAVDDGAVIAAYDAFTLADLKHAWRAGLLRRPPFPRRLAKLAGGIMLLLSVAGGIFALGDGVMRIWVAVWALLALGWIARTLAKP